MLWLGLVLAMAACLPVLVARYPQMSDYPAHLARYYVMLDGGRSPALAHWYSFAWEWTGNVGVDLLIRPFAAVFGVEQGARIIAGLIPPLTGLALLAVEISLRGRITAACFVAFAFIWSPMMLIGLLNFTLGLALALFAFALWVWMDGGGPALGLAVRFSKTPPPTPSSEEEGAIGCAPSSEDEGAEGCAQYAPSAAEEGTERRNSPSASEEGAKRRDSPSAAEEGVGGWCFLLPWIRPALFLPIGLAVWLCHLSAWGVLGILVFGYEATRRGMVRAAFAPWPLLLPLAAMLRSAIVHHGGPRASFSYGPMVLDYKGAIWLRDMRDSFFWVDVSSLAPVLLLVLAAIAARRFDWRLGTAALIMLALSLALPRHISGGDYADFRMISTGLMIACLGVDWGWPRGSQWIAPLLYAGRLAITTDSWQADSAQTERLLQALDHLPYGTNVASAVLVPSEVWRLDHFEHIGCYAVLRRDAMVNANFAVPHVHMLHLRAGGFADPSHRIRQRGDLPVDLAHFAPATRADYLWYVGVKPPASLPPGARVIWQSSPGTGSGQQTSLLARLAKPASTA